MSVIKYPCANAADTDTCGQDCHLMIPAEMTEFRTDMAEWVARNTDWGVTMHRCLDPAHPLHVLLFCSRRCSIAYDLRNMKLEPDEVVVMRGREFSMFAGRRYEALAELWSGLPFTEEADGNIVVVVQRLDP